MMFLLQKFSLCTLILLSNSIRELERFGGPMRQQRIFSDNDFTRAVRSVNLQLFHEFEHYENTFDTPKGITIAQDTFS